MTPPDYPVAHSMDSCWFAVDLDGRVGFFQTGEAGARPTRGLLDEAVESARRWLAREVPAGEYEVDLCGRLLPYLEDGGMRHLFGGSDWPVLAFLDSLDPVRPYLDSGLAAEVKARDGFAVLWPRLSEVEYQWLHRDEPEICRGCFWQFDTLEVAEDEPRSNLARHGVYVFAALGGNTAAHPYGVQLIPAAPVHVDQLPPDLRARLKEVQFNAVSFAHTPVFQPVDHVPCIAHEPVYTDMKGRKHQLPDWNLDDIVEEISYRRWLAEREPMDEGEPGGRPPG